MSNRKGNASLRKYTFFILAAAAAVIAGWLLYISSFEYNEMECAVMIVEDESFLSDFEVVNNEVHIHCVVSLKNNSSDTKEVRLVGNFPSEAESGLLKENSLVAHFIKDNTDSIIIDGNSTIKYIEIEFVGEYAGKSGMSDRMLPNIEVMETEAD